MQYFKVRIPKKISTNVYYRAHYMAKNSINNDFYNEVFAAVIKQKIKPISNYPAKVSFVFFLHGRLLDWVNLSAMAKMIEDGLVKNGILENDDKRYISQGALSCEKSNAKYDYCIITFA